MFLIDFKGGNGAAFMRGFIKGLVAPAMIGASPEFPEDEPVPYINVNDIIPTNGLKKDADALYGDLIRSLDKTP